MEENRKTNWLTVELFEKSIDLSDNGINNLAWEYPTICNVLELAKSNDKIILGGDVFFLKNGRPESKGDSWYYNKTGINDVSNGYKIAKEYIEKFMKNNEECIFTIVVV